MKLRFRKPVALLVTGAIALGGLAACGDDEEDSGESSAEALSSEALASESDAICKEHTDAINGAVSEISKGGQPAAVDVRVVTKDVVLPQYTAQIGQLDVLEPPEEMADTWDTWITDSTAVRDAIKDDPSIIFEPSEFEAVNAQAQELGLGEDCQAGPTTA